MIRFSWNFQNSIRVVSVFLAAGLILTGCGGSGGSESAEEQTVPVEIQEIQKGVIREIYTYTGSIDPWRSLNIVPQVAGKVQAIHVEIGDRVREGQVLAELDRETFRLQFQQAEAGLAVARSSLSDAEKNYERAQDLFQRGSMSRQQYEKIQLAFDAARAQFQQAQSGHDLAQWQLEASIMKAPFDGVITGRWLDEGDMINPQMPSGPGVISIADLFRVKVRVHASEAEVIRISRGKPVFIKVDVYPDEVFEGEVHAVNAAANPMTRTFEVQVAAANPRNLLKSGMFARVRVVTGEKQDVVVIPRDAVLGRGDHRHVWVLQGDSAVYRRIGIGIIEAMNVEITQGLESGERLIVTGHQMLNQGSRVRLVGGE
ncbi:MAG TPA: efflux RND transporter periplasmic adaptor subunit [bacterium]|nr:efflux RND transporter periplasmic adaptor subunit [bacterium]